MTPAANPALTGIPILTSFKSISVYLEQVSFNPTQALQVGIMMRDRRRARRRAPIESIWTSSNLQRWVSSSESALAHVNSSFIRKEVALDFTLDIIEMVKLTKTTVVWYLGMDTHGRPISVPDVLRSLLRQVAEQIPEKMVKAGLSEEHFRTCETSDHWLRLLVSVVTPLPRLVLVIDARENSKAILSIVSRFKKEIEGQKARVVCKFLVLTCEAPPDMISGLSTQWMGHYYELDMSPPGMDHRPPSRVTYSPRGRSRNSRFGDQVTNNGKLCVQRLWDQSEAVDIGSIEEL